MEFSLENAKEWISSYKDGVEVTLPTIFVFEDDPYMLQQMLNAARLKRMKVIFEQEQVVFNFASDENTAPLILMWYSYLVLNKKHCQDYIHYLMNK
ncbi:MAG: hypothetical protein IJ313_09530 [Clostridia bacterium]|nr:hypothetical protein [Clostridia bacterium]